MEKEETKKKSVCAFCNHCITYDIPSPNAYIPNHGYLCGNRVIISDNISGAKRYADCNDINAYGDCEDFESKNCVSWLSKLFK